MLTDWYPDTTDAIADRQQICRHVRQWLEFDPLVLDTETTGVGQGHEVIELTLVDRHGHVVFDSLFRPSVRISAGAMAVNHITEDMVADAPRWQDHADQLSQLVSQRPLIAFNAPFDRAMIRRTQTRYGLPVWSNPYWCAMRAYAIFRGIRPDPRRRYQWQGLQRAAQQCQLVSQGTPHRARADTLLTWQLLMYLADQADYD